MMRNVNCIHNDKGAWCKNKNIKRSLFGLGARCCVEFQDRGVECKYKKMKPKPKFPPPKPPPKRIIREGFLLNIV